ncbi:hypothetical protein IGI37_000078 [Enterococcus sp. AZ194]|uniref:YopX family protein n=1 Tax=Enterococcus sp. AZ194 TaxID=2774629 RepID=UPI003F222936
MREIKFRALDKTDKKMIFWNRLLNGHNLRNVFMRPEMCGLILMQYTGLKDKNGVEIYEGDIAWDSYGEVYGQIVFNEGKFTYDWENISDDLFEVCEDIEVRGNIYSNPELLKESRASE